ncbi:PPE domain-containing protein [Pseudonocardia spinosispora]|uniref:PPE domain-containing protein n=1 Tax=Pseudonocardia spinosispora TaxID=103441 RepID=UPI00146FA3F1|nr:hypothetical protein [Pseudonocardia spinosispora]
MRPAGMTLEQMYATAQSSTPAVATSSGEGFTKVSAGLYQVSQGLRGSLDKIGTGWQGQGAQAAQTGIGQHVQWAQTAARESTAVAANAEAHAQSVTHVKNSIPDPATIAASTTNAPGGRAPDGSPNAAAVEGARREAEQRARELFKQHAGNCRSNTPRTALTAPPTAGSAAGAKAGASGSRAPATRGRGAGVKAPGPAAGGAAGAAGAGGARTSAASSVRQASAVNEGAGRAGMGARPSSTRGYQPGGFSEMVPGTNGYLAERSTRRAPRGGPAPAAALPGPDGQGRKRGRGPRPSPEAVVPGGPAHPSRPAPRQLTARGEGHLDAGQPSVGYPYGPPPPGTEQAGAPGHGGPQQAMTGAHGGMVSPMMGGSGMSGSSGSEQRHQTPAYLLDDFELFDGDSWVVPPVIGK